MTTTQLHGWGVGVERGPGWVFVSLEPPRETSSGLAHPEADAPPLAEDLWEVLHQHMADRLVLQMEHVQFLSSYLIGQLVLLHKRIHNAGGIVRLCGLTPANEEVLHISGLHTRFPHYDSLDDAIRGAPVKPR